MVWIEVYYGKIIFMQLYITQYILMVLDFFLVVVRYQLILPMPIRVTLLVLGQTCDWHMWTNPDKYGWINHTKPRETVRLLQYRVSVQNSFQIQILWHLVRPKYPFHLHNDFESLHRAWQRYCHVLCKIPKRFGNVAMGYGQTRFREIWVWDAFRTDIL